MRLGDFLGIDHMIFGYAGSEIVSLRLHQGNSSMSTVETILVPRTTDNGLVSGKNIDFGGKTDTTPAEPHHSQ